VEGSVDQAIDRAAEELAPRLTGRVATHQPLAPLTSLRVGGPAALYIEPADEQDLQEAAGVVSRLGLDTLVLGRGTNLLICDDGFPGAVFRIAKGFEWIRMSGESVVSAGGGLRLPQVANWAARRRLEGMEFAIAIPATVGGGVRMNAGAHGKSISDVLVSARVWRLGENRADEMTGKDLAMTYRRSALGSADVVCSASFQLAPGDGEEIRAKMESYRRHRAETQPNEAPNAGSMFRNPPGGSAGKLIESAGLKGKQVGGAEVSRLHANFFLAREGARAQDFYDLMSLVQAGVKAESGTTLVPEVRIIGTFDTSRGSVVSS
jgi:UDP-N-acetylmuramate dehydrogenase